VRSALTHFADDFVAREPDVETTTAQFSARTEGMR
jgi:hypothetical protein